MKRGSILLILPLSLLLVLVTVTIIIASAGSARPGSARPVCGRSGYLAKFIPGGTVVIPWRITR